MKQSKNIDTFDTYHELITPEHQWNIPLIRSVFLAPDAQDILKIPLRASVGEDWLAWEKKQEVIQ